jgi:hypothetical protein
LPGSIPEVAFTMLIWEPYRARVLELIAGLLERMRQTDSDSSSVAEVSESR